MSGLVSVSPGKCMAVPGPWGFVGHCLLPSVQLHSPSPRCRPSPLVAGEARRGGGVGCDQGGQRQRLNSRPAVASAVCVQAKSTAHGLGSEPQPKILLSPHPCSPRHHFGETGVWLSGETPACGFLAHLLGGPSLFHQGHSLSSFQPPT